MRRPCLLIRDVLVAYYYFSSRDEIWAGGWWSRTPPTLPILTVVANCDIIGNSCLRSLITKYGDVSSTLMSDVLFIGPIFSLVLHNNYLIFEKCCLFGGDAEEECGSRSSSSMSLLFPYFLLNLAVRF